MPIGTMNRPEDVTHVVAFDRDYTIDVNFDSAVVSVEHGVADPEPVPLRWVKHWAHDDPSVDVWASGNQHLRNEAEIPGIEEARQVWESKMGYDAEDRYENAGYHSYKPQRRDGLRLIRDCYEDTSIEFIVVDDVNLRDMDHWEYYTPWNFVEWQRGGHTGLSDPSGTSYTGTSVESKACDEDLQRHASVIE